MKEQLDQILYSLDYVQAEFVLIAGALLLLGIGLFLDFGWLVKTTYVSVLIGFLFFCSLEIPENLLFEDYYQVGNLEQFFKALFGFFALWLVFFPSEKKQGVEYYFILLCILTGAVFMISANHLLLFYLAMELTSFCSYIIINLGKGKRVYEAGMKYLLFGGTSSAIMLYGLSIIYGYHETLYLSSIGNFITEPFYLFGLITALGGLFFKVSIFPFHIWVPSTYQEGPCSAVALIATVPKIAGLVVMMKWVAVFNLFSYSWGQHLFILLSIATIVIGVLAAIGQSNARRMIAYGSVAHSGFLLCMLVVPVDIGLNAFVWYSVIYAVMNLAIFFMLSSFEQNSIIEVADYSGLGSRNAYLGGLFVVVLISLIGLPPTLGFNAKLYLFSALWSFFQESNDYWVLTLFLVAIASTVVSLFFYLKIPFQYFLKPSNEVSVNVGLTAKIVATFFCLILLLGFLQPNLLITIIDNVKLK